MSTTAHSMATVQRGPAFTRAFDDAAAHKERIREIGVSIADVIGNDEGDALPVSVAANGDMGDCRTVARACGNNARERQCGECAHVVQPNPCVTHGLRCNPYYRHR